MIRQTRINTRGVALWAGDTGQGDPVLLISGANAPALMWPEEFVQLIVKQGFRAVRYDHRDTGKSDRIDFDADPYSISDLSEDAVAVLDGLGLAKAHVVGFSLGGTLGQLMALDHPDRLLSLTLMMTAALDVDFSGNWLRALKGEPAEGILPTPRPEVVRAFQAPLNERETELDRRVAQWRLLSSPGEPFDVADYRAREEAEMDHAGEIPAPFAHAMATPVPTERGRELRHVNLPTLVIQAVDDPLNPPPHGRHLATLIPGAKLVELNGLGHAFPRSHFAQLVDLLADHWARTEPAG